MKEDDEEEQAAPERRYSRKPTNLALSFMLGSTEFLRTLGEMSAKADESDTKPVIIQRKDFREMVATIELYHDMTEQIFLKYQQEVTLHRLTAINEHAKLIVLDRELRNIYNEMYRHKTKMPPELMTAWINHLKKTALPTVDEMNKEVILKNNSDTNGKKA